MTEKRKKKRIKKDFKELIDKQKKVKANFETKAFLNKKKVKKKKQRNKGK